MVKFAFRFFVHALNNLVYWPQIFPYIQTIINNISFLIIKKTLNKITYSFAFWASLTLFLVLAISNTLAMQVDTSKAILFALFNQKLAYNYMHQLFFMKLSEWAILQLYKDYFILSTAGVIKKLIQQYNGLFLILEKVGYLAYKFAIFTNCRIYPVFFIT